MTQDTRDWWSANAKYYQDELDIPPKIHYGPGAGFEDELEIFEEDEITTNTNVLEVGCGGANCSVGFAKKGCTVVGIDLSSEQLEYARENVCDYSNISIINCDCRSLPFIENTFDIVFSAYVFEWVDDWSTVFGEISNVLTERGIFVFSVPHPAFRMVDEDIKISYSYFDTGKRHEDSDQITYSFTISQTYDFLIDNGFDVINIFEPTVKNREKKDPWVGKWRYSEELLEKVPATIIFKAIKK